MRAVGLQKLRHGLGELVRTLVDVECKGLLILSLVVDIKLVSKALTRNILSECDDFLFNCHDVRDIDLPLIARLPRL